MSTYRTGNNWGVTIVREGSGEPNPSNCGLIDDQLVAVVVNGDQELAERICTLLNAPTPDVGYLRGVSETLAEVRRRLDGLTGEMMRQSTAFQILELAAAELGLDEDAPSARPVTPSAAEQGSGVGRDANGDPEGSASAYRPPHPGEAWWWPTECAHCHRPIGPWSPENVGSEMTHIVDGGGPDWDANRDHTPVTEGVKW